MKINFQLITKMIVVTLCSTGCKKESIELVREKKMIQALMPGNVGWKGAKPIPKAPTKVPQNAKPSSSKGGILARDEIYDTVNRGILENRAFKQKNGQKIYLEKLESGKYNAVRMDKEGNFPATMKNWSSARLAEMGKNEKWPDYIVNSLDKDN